MAKKYFKSTDGYDAGLKSFFLDNRPIDDLNHVGDYKDDESDRVRVYHDETSGAAIEFASDISRWGSPVMIIGNVEQISNAKTRLEAIVGYPLIEVE